LAALQAAFAKGLLAADEEALSGLESRLADSGGAGAAARLAVYRNNVTLSLIKVVEAAYPIVLRVVGGRFFAYAARAYIRVFPPTEARLSRYGGGFCAFLETFEPAAALAYLPDLARLEWARNEAYFAAEAVPLSAADFAGIAPERAGSLRLRAHPSLRLVRAAHPVLDIWLANQEAEVGRVDLSAPGQAAAVLRANGTVENHSLHAGEAAFLSAILDGARLDAAMEAGDGAAPGADLGAVFGRLIAIGAFSGYGF